MDADRLLQLASNPHHIEGIYNYCDRWCERCAFTDRCFQYASTRDRPEPANDEEAMKLALRETAENFELARELLERAAKEFGIPMPTEEELEEAARDEEERRRRTEAHPITRAAHAYLDLVGAWLEAERDALRARAEDLVARAERGDDERIASEASQVHEALEIVTYDRYFIAAKLHRALSGRDRRGRDEDPDADPVQNDSNGSAKVALISIDRSEAAWRLLDAWMPSSGTARLLADHLARLRLDVERDFPDARRFKRPGFDDVDLAEAPRDPAT